MSNDLFDFGFTAVDYDPEQTRELESTAKKLQGEKSVYEEAFQKLRADVDTLLGNLAANPSKEYIYWPNRVEKIEEFRDRINSYAPPGHSRREPSSS